MTQNSNAKNDIIPGLSAHHHRILERIFQHPLSHNLTLRDVTSLIESVGTVETKHNGDVSFSIDGQQLSLEKPRDKDLTTDETMALRHFLKRAGWSVEPAPTEVPDAGISDIVIIIDHADANIHVLAPETRTDGPDRPGKPVASHHVRHEVDPQQHDADREETYPADLLFFEKIASYSGGKGRLVIIGHGKGQSNEANHLLDYFKTHKPEIHARIYANLVADLTHLTLPQLLELAHKALPDARRL